MRKKADVLALICASILVTATFQTCNAASTKVIQLDNAWLQELKIRVGGGTLGHTTYSGFASVWGYDELSGGIYDNFSWFENGAYAAEGEHIVAMVDKQELDFWAGGHWYAFWDNLAVKPTPVPDDLIPGIYYPNTTEHYLGVLENYVFYFDQAYVALRDLFGTDAQRFFMDANERLVILYMLGGQGAGLADLPITVEGTVLDIKPAGLELYLSFHEMGHTFTGGGRWLAEEWADVCADYAIDRLGLENKLAGGCLPKDEMITELTTYERAGAPFENVVLSANMIFENSYVSLPMGGIIFALGENAGYENFHHVRFTPLDTKSKREDTINLMYQLYPAIGDNMWSLFKRWNFPVDEDTDGDGLNNQEEIKFGSSPLTVDSDSDGLNDNKENALGTNPWSQDTDNDGLSDGNEVNLYGTNPLLADSDNDGIDDYHAVFPESSEQPEPSFRWGDYFWLVFSGFIVSLVVSAIVLKVLRKKR